MKNILAALTLIFSLATLAAPAHAETYEEATNALCEKIKSCALADMRMEDMDDADKRMMMNMMDNMCLDMQQNYTAAPNSPHYDEAAACMRSMADLTCGEFQAMSEENPTEECAAFKDTAQ